jgi:DNA polymerase III subunit delta'
MFFNEVIGQDELKRNLIQLIHENRLNHAWLFFGAEGTGSLPLALAFARYILCTSRQENDACGECPSCKKINKYIHPDLHFVYPVNKTHSVEKENVTSDDFIAEWREFIIHNSYRRLTQWYVSIDLENKQGIINTEESKRLSKKLSMKPYESDYKVVIIWQPEKMNDQAANKLLKILEEPPPFTVFILVCENPDLLLPTIVSRCTSLKIPPISNEALIMTMMTKHNLTKNIAENVTRLSSGNYLRACELIEEKEEENYNFVQFRELMRSCFKKSISELLKITDNLASLTREKQKSFLEYGLKVLRESFALHYHTSDIVFIEDEEIDFLRNFAPFISGTNIILISNEFNKAIQDIERNANGRIVLLDMALKLSSYIRN